MKDTHTPHNGSYENRKEYKNKRLFAIGRNGLIFSKFVFETPSKAEIFLQYFLKDNPLFARKSVKDFDIVTFEVLVF